MLSGCCTERSLFWFIVSVYCFTFHAFVHAIFVSSIQNSLLFGEDFYARKSVRLQQMEAQMHREVVDSRIGIPSKSKAYSTELIDGYDLADKFEYLPDDSIDTGRQVITYNLEGFFWLKN